MKGTRAPSTSLLQDIDEIEDLILRICDTAHSDRVPRNLQDGLELLEQRINGPRVKLPGQPDMSTGAIRQWAKANGIAVTERGRISAEVVQRYQEAHQ